MSLSIKKTGAVIRAGINVRSELSGEDETEGACDFTLVGIMLDRDDLNELYGDKYYWDSLFNQKGKLVEPMTRRNAPAKFIGKYENSHITLWLGLTDSQEKFSACKLRKITIEPQTGGLCELTVQVQCNPNVEQLGALYLHQGKDVSTAIRFGREEVPKEKAQPELPLGTVTEAGEAARH